MYMLIMTFVLGTTEENRACYPHGPCHINTSFEILHMTVVEDMPYPAVVGTYCPLVVGTYCLLVDNDHA